MMDKNMNLFKVTMSYYGGTFYVVAADAGAAEKIAESQWKKWDYASSKGRAVSVELIAEGSQYPARDIAWLLTS